MHTGRVQHSRHSIVDCDFAPCNCVKLLCTVHHGACFLFLFPERFLSVASAGIQIKVGVCSSLNLFLLIRVNDWFVLKKTFSVRLD